MSEIKDRASTAAKTFPTNDDVARWESLRATDKRAIIEFEEEVGFCSGVAPTESASARLARVRAAR